MAISKKWRENVDRWRCELQGRCRNISAVMNNPEEYSPSIRATLFNTYSLLRDIASDMESVLDDDEYDTPEITPL